MRNPNLPGLKSAVSNRPFGQQLLPSFEEQERDPKAIYKSIQGEDPNRQLDMGEQLGYAQRLASHYDERVKRTRAAEDEGWNAIVSSPGAGIGQGDYANSMLGIRTARTQEDAANGPQGYNRQWIGMWEPLRKSRVKMGSFAAGMPGHTEQLRQGTSIDEFSRFSGDDEPLAGLKAAVQRRR